MALDDLQIYFGEDYVINDKISVYQPTIGDIVKFGEQKYYSIVELLTAIPSDMKSVLWDNGIDYEKISDFELFIMLSKNLTDKDTCLLLGKINLSKFALYKQKENDELVLYDINNDIVLDQRIHYLITDYIRKMHGFTKKIEKSANEFTKKILIQEDRDKRAINNNKPYKSRLKPLISSMVNSEGFKYKLQELRDVGICEFMDSVKRIQTIQHVKMLNQGIYCGNIDGSKIFKSELNWMKELD
jgi:hypothetical protein